MITNGKLNISMIKMTTNVLKAQNGVMVSIDDCKYEQNYIDKVNYQNEDPILLNIGKCIHNEGTYIHNKVHMLQEG